MASVTPPLEYHRYEVIDGVETVWHLPPSDDLNNKVTNVLFVAPGCHHRATDFFTKTLVCPQCIGLAEEVKIAQSALRKGMAVVAMSAADTTSRCWTAKDISRVKAALASLFTFPAFPQRDVLNFYGLGVSSGASFIATFATQQSDWVFVGIVMQVMSIPPFLIQELELRKVALPPILFVQMSRDVSTAKKIRESLFALWQASKDDGNHNSDICPGAHLEVKPHPIFPDYFHQQLGDRIVSKLASRGIFMALNEGGFLYFQPYQTSMRGQGHYISEDPRYSDWRKVIRPFMESWDQGSSMTFTLTPDQCSLSEGMNVAYAHHEITSEWIHDSLMWLAAKGSINYLRALGSPAANMIESCEFLRDTLLPAHVTS